MHFTRAFLPCNITIFTVSFTGFTTFVMDDPNRSNEISYNEDQVLKNNRLDIQDSGNFYDSALCHTDRPKRKTRHISRRHTLGGSHEPSQVHKYASVTIWVV